MNWLDIYKPKYLKDIKTNKDEINKAITWIENYKKKIPVPKVLFILGDTGVGKTLLAELLLKEYKYQKIELNSTDVRSQKKIGDFLIKSLTYKNVVDMFNEGNAPIGLLIDEIDTICKLSDKGGFTEFLSILKNNEKYETLKKNIESKKKIRKTKVLVDDYIKLYNPIICTSNNINDKKINELKKYSETINLNKPSNEDLFLIINDIYNIHNQKIEDNVKIELANYSQGDIRRLIILLEDLHYFSNGNVINIKIFEKFKKTYSEKEEDIQLVDATKLLITKKMSVKESQLLFDIECLLIPLMLYHNSIDYIKNTEDDNKTKLKAYKNVLNSLCIHDTIQTNIFEVQDWDELYGVASIYGSSLPNYYLTELKNKKPVQIQFTSLLNKISQMYVNKKLVNSAKFSIGKINYDNDEIIYLTEIMSHYFDIYKENIIEDDNDDDDIEEKNNIVSEINYKKPLNNNSELIKFMNRYNMNINSLENILKIEKLNQINEKRKKKFTLKIKKEISNFLLVKDSENILCSD
jgi:Holliday junction resolvasome RuvABC ATP-dependent DNA helicase subunit